MMVNKGYRHVQSARLERWLGTEKVESLSRNFRDWYGPPVHLVDVPGSVRVCKGGDFIGPFEHGMFGSALDAFADHIDRLRRMPKRIYMEAGRPHAAMLASGFGSISDLLARSSGGFEQLLNGNIQKTGVTGVANSPMSLWRLGNMPAAGAAGSAAPGGRAPTKSTTGAMAFNNPSSGTLHLTGADMAASVINNALLLYDRIFDVAKTMSSTGTESVTGVPTRYQNSTAGTEDYAGGNFLFPEIHTTLGATAHNWTVCQYRDESNNDAQTLPSFAGINAGIQDRLDFNVSNQWFAFLATGDSGIKDLHQLQCSASVTGAVTFVIGHPIGVMSFPVINSLLPFNWITNRRLAPRIFDDAALALLELPKPATTATSYHGMAYAVGAAP